MGHTVNRYIDRFISSMININKIYGTNRQWMGRLTQSKLIGLHSHPDKVNNLKRKTTVESCIEHGGK